MKREGSQTCLNLVKLWEKELLLLLHLVSVIPGSQVENIQHYLANEMQRYTMHLPNVPQLRIWFKNENNFFLQENVNHFEPKIKALINSEIWYFAESWCIVPCNYHDRKGVKKCRQTTVRQDALLTDRWTTDRKATGRRVTDRITHIHENHRQEN